MKTTIKILALALALSACAPKGQQIDYSMCPSEGPFKCTSQSLCSAIQANPAGTYDFVNDSGIYYDLSGGVVTFNNHDMGWVEAPNGLINLDACQMRVGANGAFVDIE